MTLPDTHPGQIYDVVCEAVRFRMAIESAPPGAVPTQLRESIVREVKAFTAALIDHAKSETTYAIPHAG